MNSPPSELTTTDAALLDLDGVLVDSRVAFARCVNAALREHGLTERRDEELHAYLGPPLHHAFVQLGVGEKVESCVETYRRRYRVFSATETRVVPGIPQLLAELAARMPLIVATSKPRALAEPLLEALGIRHRFDAVVGPALTAEHETKGTTIQRALGHLTSERRPVMIGDRKFDVIGATEHGLPAVGVLWGIGSAEELTQAGAAALARRPHELLSLLGTDQGRRRG